MNTNFKTRQDYTDALEALLAPLPKYYSPGKALMMPGYSGAPYGETIAGLEGFSRVLWGLIPFWAGGGKSGLDDFIPEGITNGTNPAHPEYWGSYTGVNQAYVEMAALGYGLLLTPEKIWEPLAPQAKEASTAWLLQMNENPIPDNNWTFFRILINCGLRNVGSRYSAETLEKDLKRIDDFYLGDGWYSDGPTQQRDYYIAFAMHFYSLLYVYFCEKTDPERCRVYRQRSARFAQDYLYWFGARGEALPFGRSLTYRFAQTCFWCALALVGEECMPWGVIKGIVNRHFRWWFSRPILDCEEKLTLGYAYPNLTMCEGYNAPGSPYWAFKSFVILALPESHPFWQAQELPLPKLDKTRFLPHARMILQRSADGYTTALTSGQYADWEPAFTAEKYEKFAYSSYFGFQTARGYNELHLTAPDNALAFYRDGLYHVRRKCEQVICEPDRIFSVWKPLEDVTVETTIRPCKNGHTRHHKITAQRACRAVEGGFSLAVHDGSEIQEQTTDASLNGTPGICITGSFGSSSITLLTGSGKPGWTVCEPNVNVLYPRTVLPYLEYEIPEGVTEIEVYVEGIPASK